MGAIERIEAKIIETPLRRPFVTARDRLARQVSRHVEITLTLSDGAVARGQSVPVEYVTGETAETVVEAVSAARTHLLGREVDDPPALAEMLEAQVPGGPSARAGLEMALFRAWSQATGASLWERWGAATDRVETDITLSMVEDVADRAVEAAGRGFSIFKIKVGSHRPGLDLARLKEVHGALPQARFRLDANQAFGADEALRFLDAALSAGLPIDLLEQPVSKGDLRALDEVARRSAVPIFADEAVLGPRDALRLLRQTAVRGVNVKLMKCGIAGALRIIQIAQEEQRELMIGCMLETRQGVLASLELACGTDAFRYVDLDSHLLLDEAGENPWFHQEGPALILRPPLTLEPDRQVSSAHPPPDPGRRGLE